MASIAQLTRQYQKAEENLVIKPPQTKTTYFTTLFLQIDCQWKIRQKRRLYRCFTTIHKILQYASRAQQTLRRSHRHILHHIRLFPLFTKRTRFRYVINTIINKTDVCTRNNTILIKYVSIHFNFSCESFMEQSAAAGGS